MKGEQQKKQRDELMDNPLMSNSNASGARNRASEEAGNDLIETEQRQQMVSHLKSNYFRELLNLYL